MGKPYDGTPPLTIQIGPENIDIHANEALRLNERQRNTNVPFWISRIVPVIYSSPHL
jgi:hypothetical protein